MDSLTEETRRRSYKEAMRDASRLQHAVYAALARRGPHTTIELADLMQMNLLTIRPRMTELLQAGLVKTIGRTRQGALFRACTAEEFDAAQAAQIPKDDNQLKLF